MDKELEEAMEKDKRGEFGWGWAEWDRAHGGTDREGKDLWIWRADLCRDEVTRLRAEVAAKDKALRAQRVFWRRRPGGSAFGSCKGCGTAVDSGISHCKACAEKMGTAALSTAENPPAEKPHDCRETLRQEALAELRKPAPPSEAAGKCEECIHPIHGKVCPMWWCDCGGPTPPAKEGS